MGSVAVGPRKHSSSRFQVPSRTLNIISFQEFYLLRYGPSSTAADTHWHPHEYTHAQSE
jgi:hypothetical protein